MTVTPPVDLGIPAPIKVTEDQSDIMTCAFRVPICWIDLLDDLADEQNTSRAALIRQSLVQTHLGTRLNKEQLTINTRKRTKLASVIELPDNVIDAIIEAYANCQLSVDDVARLFSITYEESRWALSQRNVVVNRGPRNIEGLTFGAIQRIFATSGIKTDQLPLVLGLTPKTIKLIAAAQKVA